MIQAVIGAELQAKKSDQLVEVNPVKIKSKKKKKTINKDVAGIDKVIEVNPVEPV